MRCICLYVSHGIPSQVHRRPQYLVTWNIPHPIFSNVHYGRLSTFGDGGYLWFYRYHLPMIVWTVSVMADVLYTMVYVAVLLYSTGTFPAYMARASLWSTYVFYITWYFYTL